MTIKTFTDYRAETSQHGFSNEAKEILRGIKKRYKSGDETRKEEILKGLGMLWNLSTKDAKTLMVEDY